MEIQRDSHAEKKNQDELEAGTGFMQSLSDAIRHYEGKGYGENLAAEETYFSCRSGEIKIYPKEVVVDKVLRFENTSDPADQSVLYVISAPAKNIKGLYVESYGIYNEQLSKELQSQLEQKPEN